MFPDLKDSHARSPERDLIESVRNRVIEMIRQCLAAGVEDGTIECKDIEKTAWIINGLVFGISHMNIMSEKDMPDLAESTIEFCRRALEPSPWAADEKKPSKES
ncbi:MAG: hypothetical protein ACOC0W_04045 [Desulfosalsimonas sp.]